MHSPKMILFDYGHTLLYEPDWDPVRGTAALMQYVVRNPNHCTVEDVRRASDLVYGVHLEAIQTLGYDVSARVGDKLLYDYLGIQFSLSPVEMETVFWDNATPGAIMPGADTMLDYINKVGIRSGVVSNLRWSGEALTRRIQRLLPRNQFEFVFTSSDYLIRKSNRLLFDVALQKAGLRPEEVWYVGDNPKADIEGAAQVGIFPVWLDSDTDREGRDHAAGIVPQCGHLHIREWSEMVAVLEQLRAEAS